MSDLLGDAQVEAAAEMMWLRDGFTHWRKDKPDVGQASYRANARAALSAALPLIETQLREQIANEIQSHADYAKKYEPDSKFLVGLDCAARVVRGTTNQGEAPKP